MKNVVAIIIGKDRNRFFNHGINLPYITLKPEANH